MNPIAAAVSNTLVQVLRELTPIVATVKHALERLRKSKQDIHILGQNPSNCIVMFGRPAVTDFGR